jgi:hypothetical protein
MSTSALHLGGRVGGADERDSRIRVLRANAEIKEMELAEKRGDVVLLSDIERMYSGIIMNARAQFLAIPARLAPQLVGEESLTVIQTKLDRAIKSALNSMITNGSNTPDRAR